MDMSNDDIIGEVTDMYWVGDRVTVTISQTRPRQAPRTRRHFPKMKERGGRRRARKRQTQHDRDYSALVDWYLGLGHTFTSAQMLANHTIMTRDMWRMPDDPFDPKTWTITTGATR